jgi:hypothetical protein
MHQAEVHRQPHQLGAIPRIHIKRGEDLLVFRLAELSVEAVTQV